MKRGEFGISDLIVFILFVILILAFFAVMSWNRGDQVRANFVIKPSGGFQLQSYLRSPVYTDIDADGIVDAKTVADLIVLSYSDENAMAELESELVGTAAFIRDNGGRLEVRVVYPDGETVESGQFINVDNENPTIQDRVVFLPLPDGELVRVYYDNFGRAEDSQRIEGLSI